ncbi:MAG: DNA polymerase, partial [Pseudomonadota bacterium]|nr:DNA polymerase [Pseudomonadota bacterium]
MSSLERKPVVLVDGSSYLFRAYHALPPLMNSKGMHTGAVYGVANMLRKLINDYEPEHIAVVFDSKGKTFRHKMYEPYKANRTVMPDELRVQIQPLHDLIKAMGLPLIVVDGVEADDVIGTLTIQAKQDGYPVLISTGDKDLCQLVNSHVTLLNTMTNVSLNEQGVMDKFGVKPSQMIDYLALVGDSSDNIPGVPKVGPKTAQKWLQEYGSLDAIVANADKISGKVGEYLRESLPNIPMSVQLVTIKCDVELDLTPAELVCLKPDNSKLRQLFTDLEFKSWLTKLDQELIPAVKQDYETVLSQEQFTKWMGKLKLAKTFAFNTDTTSLDPTSAELVGVSFAIGPGEAAYVPVGHTYREAPEQLDRDFVLEHLQDVFDNPERIVIGHNIKYALIILGNYGVSVKSKLYDTMLEAYVLNGGTGRNDIASLAIKYLHKATTKFEEVAGKGSKQLTFNRVHLEDATRFSAEVADNTYQLHQKIWPQLAHHLRLQFVFNEIEMPLVRVLSHVERNGVLIDAKKLAARSVVMGKRIDTLEKEARALAGNDFNLSSTKQLREVLYDQMNLPVLAKTPKGQPSTSEVVLQEL